MRCTSWVKCHPCFHRRTMQAIHSGWIFTHTSGSWTWELTWHGKLIQCSFSLFVSGILVRQQGWGEECLPVVWVVSAPCRHLGGPLTRNSNSGNPLFPDRPAALRYVYIIYIWSGVRNVEYPSLISLMVSVDIKDHVYLFKCWAVVTFLSFQKYFLSQHQGSHCLFWKWWRWSTVI